ncbi:MAG: TonB-dependent receptor, partial [Bacteroidota bacterium]
GTDLRFFEDRLKLTATYYENYIENLLFEVLVAPSTGFLEKYDNAAEMENKGIELDVSYAFLQSNDWNGNVFFNFNANRNKVTSLSGTESLLLAGFTNAGTRAVEGEPLGVLWGGLWAKDEASNLILDENGFPTVAAEAGIYGDPNPDWRGGAGLNLGWKDISASILFETFQGGDYSEATRGVLYTFGKHADNGNEVTPTQDILNYDGEVIPAGQQVRGNIVDWGAGPVLLDQAWYTTLGSGFGAVREQFVTDGSWTRLREASVSYTLRNSWLRNTLKLQSVVFTAAGRNLALWTDLVGVDPETSLTGGFGQGLEYFTNPGTKSYLFTLKINY